MVGHRYESEGAVAEQVGGDPAQAEHDERTERGILHDADDRLHPWRGHGLHDDAPQARAQRHRHLLEGGPNLVTGPQPESDATDVGLVHEFARRRLERYWIAETL